MAFMSDFVTIFFAKSLFSFPKIRQVLLLYFVKIYVKLKT